MSTVDNYFTSLDYTYPIFNNSIETGPTIPKDVLLSQTLKLDRIPSKTFPTSLDNPIDKAIGDVDVKTNDSHDDPLSDLLKLSRDRIKGYLANSTENLNHEVARTNNKYNQKKVIRISKRQESNDKNNASELKSRHSTPIGTKSVYFSPSGKANTPTTPVSVRKEAHQNIMRRSSNQVKQRLLKMDQASLVNLVGKQPQNDSFPIHKGNEDIKDDDHYNEEDTDDHLACHADNIMKLAVDSTMLGSTFNSSISSSFSNTFNESMSGKDFFDKEAKQSILEELNF